MIESDGFLWTPGFSLSERIPTLSPNKAHDIITHNQNIINAFSLIIESLISPLSQKHPKLCSRWATALDWYGEGCREQNDAIAITKIATSLDVLSQGGKYAGILEMLKNMFNIPEDEEILAQYAFQGLVFPGIANVMDSGKVSHFR
ncbi:hypothetical protein [Thiothrix nivea]|uniref:hypothetical protein n=1 Tax=Thiothrix nivea TaxID=1031 RepID=UPI0012B6924E|nr:hypothetical protein [Thiothrix nivea]